MGKFKKDEYDNEDYNRKKKKNKHRNVLPQDWYPYSPPTELIDISDSIDKDDGDDKINKDS